jgi:CRISPR-associated endonuclease/helicase Cas3
MAPVIVPFDAFAARKIRQLGVRRIPSGALARALQPYVVQVPPRDRARLINAGRAVFEAPDLRGDQFAVLTDLSLYDPEGGLIWEEAEELGAGDLIV